MNATMWHAINPAPAGPAHGVAAGRSTMNVAGRIGTPGDRVVRLAGPTTPHREREWRSMGPGPHRRGRPHGRPSENILCPVRMSTTHAGPASAHGPRPRVGVAPPTVCPSVLL